MSLVYVDEGDTAELFRYGGFVAESIDRTNQPNSDEMLNLKQVAAALGVHYMTAYRYVRTGQLPAVRGMYGWEIHPEDLLSFSAPHSNETKGQGNGADSDSRDRSADDSGAGQKGESVNWVELLAAPMRAGDEVEAWRVLERALATSYTPQECLVDLIPQALGSVPDPPDAVEPYLAFAVTRRIIARLGARFRRPGRSKGIVIVGSPEGEAHEVPVTILADLIRLEGFTCVELGSNVPAAVFTRALQRIAAADPTKLLGVALSISWAGHAGAVSETVSAIRDTAAELPILIGGQGVLNPDIAALLGANLWAADLHAISARLEDLIALQPRNGYEVAAAPAATPTTARPTTPTTAPTPTMPTPESCDPQAAFIAGATSSPKRSI